MASVWLLLSQTMPWWCCYCKLPLPQGENWRMYSTTPLQNDDVVFIISFILCEFAVHSHFTRQLFSIKKKNTTLGWKFAFCLFFFLFSKCHYSRPVCWDCVCIKGAKLFADFQSLPRQPPFEKWSCTLLLASCLSSLSFS